MKRQGLCSPGINEGFSRGLFLQEERGSSEASRPDPMAGLTLPPRTHCSCCHCSSDQELAVARLGITFKLPYPPLRSTPTSHHSCGSSRHNSSWLDHSGLCIFGYIVPPTWNDLSLSFCHFQDSLLHEALPDNPSPFEPSLRLPASLRHCVLYVL